MRLVASGPRLYPCNLPGRELARGLQWLVWLKVVLLLYSTLPREPLPFAAMWRHQHSHGTPLLRHPCDSRATALRLVVAWPPLVVACTPALITSQWFPRLGIMLFLFFGLGWTSKCGREGERRLMWIGMDAFVTRGRIIFQH